MNEDYYLSERISKKFRLTGFRLKYTVWIIKTFLQLSNISGIGHIIRFIVRFDPYLFGFSNGGLISRKFKKRGMLPRVGFGCIIYSPQKLEIGDNIIIGNYVTIYNISDGEEIKIGSNSHISDYSYLSGVGGLEIGSNVAISSGVRIYSYSNDYHDPTNLIKDQVKKGKIVIGSNVLIGANVVILPGVKIGNNTVIGAGAVVSKNIPENSIAIGIPARLVNKYRSL
ncbi:MAG: acyltransferase [Candidatus Methanoperedens sp.]|nr:acyltransferase [Candidatus Methanoperedens sp.]